jgi:hypothetical protein
MRNKRSTIIAVLIVIVMLFMSTATVVATEVQVLTPNPYVTIVNPVSGSVVYSDNLLVSVKMTAPVEIRVLVTQEFVVVDDEDTSVSLTEHLETPSGQIRSVEFGTVEEFTNVNNLSFFTRRVEDVTPGIYRITVQTVNERGDVLHTNSSPVEVRAPEDNAANTAQTSTQGSGTAQFLRNVLRTIFGN